MLGIIFCISALYTQYREQDKTTLPNLYPLFGNTVQVQATVADHPVQTETHTRVTLRVRAWDAPNDETYPDPAQDVRLLATLPDDFLLSRGDNVSVTGVLRALPSFGDGHYRDYLRGRGISAVLADAHIESLTPATGLLGVIGDVRRMVRRPIDTHFPDPYDRIALGIVIGLQERLPPFLDDQFRGAGLTHLLIVSGFNVTILLLFAGLVLRPLGRMATLMLSLPLLLGYVLLCGADPPVVRAGLMGALLVYAAFHGRFSDGRNILLLVAVLVTLYNPAAFTGSLSFQLSFLATAGLLIIGPFLDALLRNVPDVLRLRSLLVLTLSAQVAVLPLIALSFGNVPLGGIVANIVAEPLIPFIMLFVFGALLVGIIVPPLGFIASVPGVLLLQLLVWIAVFFSDMPMLAPPEWVAKMILGAVIAFLVWGCVSREFERKYLFAFEERITLAREPQK